MTQRITLAALFWLARRRTKGGTSGISRFWSCMISRGFFSKKNEPPPKNTFIKIPPPVQRGGKIPGYFRSFWGGQKMRVFYRFIYFFIVINNV